MEDRAYEGSLANRKTSLFKVGAICGSFARSEISPLAIRIPDRHWHLAASFSICPSVIETSGLTRCRSYSQSVSKENRRGNYFVAKVLQYPKSATTVFPSRYALRGM